MSSRMWNDDNANTTVAKYNAVCWLPCAFIIKGQGSVRRDHIHYTCTLNKRIYGNKRSTLLLMTNIHKRLMLPDNLIQKMEFSIRWLRRFHWSTKVYMATFILCGCYSSSAEWQSVCFRIIQRYTCIMIKTTLLSFNLKAYWLWII